MNCTRCGTWLPDNAAICPTCGTINSAAWPGGGVQQPTNYGQYQPGGYGGPPLQQQQAPYEQGYGPQAGYMPPQPNYGYALQPNAAPPYQYQPGPVNVYVNNPPIATRDNSGPLIVEVLLSLFLGIYGVGWLMAGETTVGVILLICSFVVYLPTLILGTIFTFGIGLFCLVPLAIGAVVLNAVLLNNALKRKVAQVMMFQEASRAWEKMEWERREWERQDQERLRQAQTLGGILMLSPYDFEKLTGTLLRAWGYQNVQRVGGSGDLGADLTAINEQGELVVVQCKRYAPGKSIGSPDIQKFIGMMNVHHGASRGIFVTTSTFTQPAIDLAKQHSIMLIDGDDLTQLVQGRPAP